MLRQLYNDFYHIPIVLVPIIIALSISLWAVLASVMPKRPFKITSCILLAAALTATLWITVTGRELTSYTFHHTFIPLAFLFGDSPKRDAVRSTIMNVFLFVPIGTLLPFVLPERLKHRVLLTVAAALILSVAIECSQIIFSIGSFETDDILTNTLGAFIGALALPLSKYIGQWRKNNL